MPIRRLVLVVMCSVAAGCSGSTAGPTATPKIELSNLRAKTFGLESVLCSRPGLVTYRSIDELTVDFHAIGATVEGATIFGRTLSTNNIQLGPPASVCSLAADPCQSRSRVCIVSGSPTGDGTLRLVTSTDWQPTTQWTVNLVAASGISNPVTASVTRTEGLPTGNTAGIYSLFMEECDTMNPPKSGCFLDPSFYSGGIGYFANLSVYHPRIAGRSLRVRLDIFTPQNRRLSSSDTTWDEGTLSGNSVGVGVQVVTIVNGNPPPPYRIVASVTETERSVVVSTDAKEISFP